MFYALTKLLQSILLWLDFILATIVLYALAWLPKIITKKWYPKIFRYWCLIFINALKIKLHLHQNNCFDLPNKYILIANHPSAFEDIGMPALFNVRFLAKYELKSWFILGKIATAAGTIFVKREDKQSRKNASTELELAIVEKNLSIGLYPEGGCKGRRLNLPFHYGVFDIAIKTNTPIIPVFLHYEAQADFEWLHCSLVKKIWQMYTASNKNVNYYLFDAIYPNKFTDKVQLCNHVQSLYLNWQKKYLE